MLPAPLDITGFAFAAVATEDSRNCPVPDSVGAPGFRLEVVAECLNSVRQAAVDQFVALILTQRLDSILGPMLAPGGVAISSLLFSLQVRLDLSGRRLFVSRLPGPVEEVTFEDSADVFRKAPVAAFLRGNLHGESRDIGICGGREDRLSPRDLPVRDMLRLDAVALLVEATGQSPGR